jgi:hypothetical protein
MAFLPHTHTHTRAHTHTHTHTHTHALAHAHIQDWIVNGLGGLHKVIHTWARTNVVVVVVIVVIVVRVATHTCARAQTYQQKPSSTLRSFLVFDPIPQNLIISASLSLAHSRSLAPFHDLSAMVLFLRIFCSVVPRLVLQQRFRCPIAATADVQRGRSPTCARARAAKRAPGDSVRHLPTSLAIIYIIFVVLLLCVQERRKPRPSPSLIIFVFNIRNVQNTFNAIIFITLDACRPVSRLGQVQTSSFSHCDLLPNRLVYLPPKTHNWLQTVKRNVTGPSGVY